MTSFLDPQTKNRWSTRSSPNFSHGVFTFCTGRGHEISNRVSFFELGMDVLSKGTLRVSEFLKIIAQLSLIDVKLMFLFANHCEYLPNLSAPLSFRLVICFMRKLTTGLAAWPGFLWDTQQSELLCSKICGTRNVVVSRANWRCPIRIHLTSIFLDIIGCTTT